MLSRCREWCIQDHDAVGEEPEHEFGGMVARQVIPHQQEAQGRQVRWQRDADPQARLPARPARTRSHGVRHRSRCRQTSSSAVTAALRQGCRTALGQRGTPWAHTAPVAGRKASAAWPSPSAGTRGVGGPGARRTPSGVPPSAPSGRARLRPGRPAPPHQTPPHGMPAQSALLCVGVGVVHQHAAPLAPPHGVPVGHQVRVRCQLQPASVSTHQIVYVLTCGSPSGARRSARCKVTSDHVAVPSRSRSGGRPASARMRSRSALV